MAEMTYYDSPLTGPELDEAFRRLAGLTDSVAAAAASAEQAAFWAGQAEHSANGALGWYETPATLRQAYPTAQPGQWALVGASASLWLWDPAQNAFVDAAATLYRATFRLEGWQGEGPWTQSAAAAPVDGGPAVRPDSVFCSGVMVAQAGDKQTNRVLAANLNHLNEGRLTAGDGVVTATVFEKPDADLEVFWQMRKGGI